MSTTDHTREALIEWFELNLPAVAGGDPDEDGMIWGKYDTTRATALADAILASSWLAAHVAAVMEGKDAEIERLRQDITARVAICRQVMADRSAAWSDLAEAWAALAAEPAAWGEWLYATNWPFDWTTPANLPPTTAERMGRIWNERDTWRLDDDEAADCIADESGIARSTTDGGQ